jgi:hypothetical protein
MVNAAMNLEVVESDGLLSKLSLNNCNLTKLPTFEAVISCSNIDNSKLPQMSKLKLLLYASTAHPIQN